MSLVTRINLWKLKRAMGPSMAFKAGLRKNLNTMWAAKYGNSASLHHVVVARVAGSFAVITMLLTGGGWVYAYNSAEVTEGSILYPVKEVIETVEEVTKITPEAKARFYIKKIERREAEREVLEKKIHLPEVKEEVEKEEVKTDKKEDVEKVISKDVKKEEKSEVVEKVRAKVKFEAEERKIKRTEKSIEKIEEELEKTRQVIEKTESKNVKLREELRIRAEKRLEKIRSNQEKLLQLRQRSGETRNTSSIKR